MFFSLESKWVLKELNYLLTINRPQEDCFSDQMFHVLRLFKALGLSFLPNFPGPTFISCPTSIPESRLGLGQNLPFLARALHPQCINQTVRLQLLLRFGTVHSIPFHSFLAGLGRNQVYGACYSAHKHPINQFNKTDSRL